MSEETNVLTPLPNFTLPESHPLAGRKAFQCRTCLGISYPDHQRADGPCPYCEDDAA